MTRDAAVRYLPQVEEGSRAAHGDCVEMIFEAAEAFPSVAITVIDGDTGGQIYP